jgi:hypothetical protein
MLWIKALDQVHYITPANITLIGVMSGEKLWAARWRKINWKMHYGCITPRKNISLIANNTPYYVSTCTKMRTSAECCMFDRARLHAVESYHAFVNKFVLIWTNQPNEISTLPLFKMTTCFLLLGFTKVYTLFSSEQPQEIIANVGQKYR